MGRGSLPEGLQFTNGLIHGVPTGTFDPGRSEPNDFVFAVIASDADGDLHHRRLHISIAHPREAPEPDISVRDIILHNLTNFAWRVVDTEGEVQPGEVTLFDNRPLESREEFEPFPADTTPLSVAQ